MISRDFSEIGSNTSGLVDTFQKYSLNLKHKQVQLVPKFRDQKAYLKAVFRLGTYQALITGLNYQHFVTTVHTSDLLDGTLTKLLKPMKKLSKPFKKLLKPLKPGKPLSTSYSSYSSYLEEFFTMDFLKKGINYHQNS